MRLWQESASRCHAARRCQDALAKLWADLDRHSEMNAVRRLFSGINPDSVRERISPAEEDRKPASRPRLRPTK